MTIGGYSLSTTSAYQNVSLIISGISRHMAIPVLLAYLIQILHTIRSPSRPDWTSYFLIYFLFFSLSKFDE